MPETGVEDRCSECPFGNSSFSSLPTEEEKMKGTDWMQTFR